MLGKEIQTDTHDSIEDAQTALLLFKKYLELQAAGTFDTVMEQVYKEGARCNFRPPTKSGRQRVISSEFL